ncbi:MAG: BatD family protein [Lentisphaeria bacterium]
MIGRFCTLMRRVRAAFLLLTAAGLGLPGGAAAWAAVEVTVEPDPLVVGETGQYQVTSDSGTPEIAALPAVPGLQWLGGPQTSSSVQIINLQVTRQATATWLFTVEKAGRYVIPAIPVTVGGKAEQLPERVVQVVTDPDAAAAGPPAGADEAGADATAGAPFFLRLFPGVPVGPDAAVYVGQELPLEIRLYARSGAVRNISYPELAVEGAVLREDPALNPKNPKFLPPREQGVTVEGHPYQMVTFRCFLTPIAAGTLKGQVAANAQVVVADRRQPRRRGPSPFDDGFFNDFFNQGRVVPRQATAALPALTVKPLPPSPAGSQPLNAVGRFTVKLAATPAAARVGEPVTVTLTLEGQGGLDGLKPPVLTPANFRVYDPEVKKERRGNTAAATVTWVLVPLDTAATLPPLAFNSFDPGTGRYAVHSFTPKLTVAPAAAGTTAAGRGLVADTAPTPTATLAGQPAARPAAAGAAEDILYIKDAPGPQVCRPLWRNHLAASTALAGAGLAAWGALTLLARRRERLLGDRGGRRRAEAARQERRLFRELREAAPETRAALIRDQLVPYLAAMLGLPPGASMNDVANRVEAQAPELAAVLRQAEAGAYRPGGGAITDIAPALAAIRRLLLAVLLPALALTGLTAAATPGPAAPTAAPSWAAAGAAYGRGDLDSAKRLYQALAPAAGAESAARFYNLGNCACRQGRLGEALADYEHARRLAPRDSDILENLNFVRRKLGLPPQGGTETPRDLLARLRDTLRPDEWALLAAGLVAAAGLAAGLRRWRSLSPWPAWGWAAPVLLACLLAGWSQLEERYQAGAEAVVIADGLTPRRLPSAAAEPAPLRWHEGDTLALMETRDGWRRLRGPDGEAWLPQDAVRPVW